MFGSGYYGILSYRYWVILLFTLMIYCDGFAADPPSLHLLFQVDVRGVPSLGDRNDEEPFFVSDNQVFYLPDWESESIVIFSKEGQYKKHLPISLSYDGVKQIRKFKNFYYLLLSSGAEVYHAEGLLVSIARTTLLSSLYYREFMFDNDFDVDRNGALYVYANRFDYDDTLMTVENYGIIYKIDPYTDTITPFYSFMDHFPEGPPYFYKLACDERNRVKVWIRAPNRVYGNLMRLTLSPSGKISEQTVYPDISGDYIGTTHDGHIVTDQSLEVIAIYNTQSRLLNTVSLYSHYRQIGWNPQAEWEDGAWDPEPGYFYRGKTQFFQGSDNLIYMLTFSRDKQYVSMLNTGPYFPDQTPLNPEILQEKTPSELRLMRNAIFARHGRQFQSSDLQEHFNRQPWYRVNPDYDDSLLTEIDEQNIKRILEFEAQKKPSSD